MHSTIIKNIDNKLELIAKSPSAPKQLSQTAETKAKLVNDRRTSIAELINTHDRNGNSAQAWNVTTPLFDNDNNVIAVISTSFLTVDAQEAINNAFQKSFIILKSGFFERKLFELKSWTLETRYLSGPTPGTLTC